MREHEIETGGTCINRKDYNWWDERARNRNWGQKKQREQVDDALWFKTADADALTDSCVPEGSGTCRYSFKRLCSEISKYKQRLCGQQYIDTPTRRFMFLVPYRTIL